MCQYALEHRSGAASGAGAGLPAGGDMRLDVAFQPPPLRMTLSRSWAGLGVIEPVSGTSGEAM